MEVTKVAQLTGHKDAVFGLDVSADGKIYSGGGDGYVVEWQPDIELNGDLLATMSASVYAVKTHGDLLIAGTANGELLVLDRIQRKSILHQKVFPGPVYDILVHDSRIILGGKNGVVVILDMDLKPIVQLRIAEDNIRKMIADNGRIFFACSDNTVRITDAETLKPIRSIDAHDNSVFALALDSKNNRLFTGSRDATIKVWDMEDNSRVFHVPAHMYHVNSLAFNPENQWLLSASMDKSIRLWDSETMQLLKVIDASKFGLHINSVNKVLWIGTNRFISCSDDRTLGLFQVDF